MNYTAIGHTVNLAARLCGNAAAGEVLLARETAQIALAQHQQYSDTPAPVLQKAGEMRVKGIEEPVKVARLVWDSKGA